MKAGDWVTIEGKRISEDRRRTESYVRTRRVAKVTPAGWIVVTGCSHPFKPHGAEYRDKGWELLRPSTPEEIEQGEALEREAAEKAQARRDAANAIRLTLPGLEWSAIDDATVERIQEMVLNPANRVKPVQMEIGKGKR